MSMINIFRKLGAKLYGSAENRHFKKFLNAVPFWTGAFISGGVAVIYAKLFSLAETGTAYFFSRSAASFFLITPACFFLAWWLIQKYAPFARGSGIPQVSAAIELSAPRSHYHVSRLLSLRVIFFKIISSLIMIFGGGVVGREGPTIQVSASIFKKINDLLPKWYPPISRRNMIVTGAAAGLAAAFNTPLGGIVFAIEELTKTHFSYFKSALLTGVIIAGLTALHFLGPYLYLGYPALDHISFRAMIFIIPVALVTGIGGAGMGKIILFVMKKKEKIKKQLLRAGYVIFCGLLLAAVSYFIDGRTFGSGKEIMATVLFTDHKYVEWYVPLLRILGPIISFSTGAAGGIFAPSLSAGAGIGAVFAGWFHLSGAVSNLVILCGMAGFLTGITRSPFTSSILVLEMTDSHNIILFLMVSCLAANIVANFISRHSFYDRLKGQYIREIHQLEAQENQHTEIKI